MKTFPTRHHLSKVLLALAMAICGFSATAALPEAATQAAIQTFDSASKGKDADIDACLSQFQALLQQEPGNPFLLSYIGAATAMKARSAWAPWSKMSLAEDGLAQIDKALALLTPAHDQARFQGSPLSLWTRLVAANTFLAIPDMFKRGPRGRALLEDIRNSPLFEQSAPGFQGAVLMRSAKLAQQSQQLAQAQAFYREVVQRQLPQHEAAGQALKGGTP